MHNAAAEAIDNMTKTHGPQATQEQIEAIQNGQIKSFKDLEDFTNNQLVRYKIAQEHILEKQLVKNIQKKSYV